MTRSLPTAILKLQGTGNPTRMKRREQHEPKPDVLKHVPEPPDYLTDEQKAIWREMAPPLVKCGVLTTLDLHTLAKYCEAWTEYRSACEVLAQSRPIYVEGGIPRINPLLKVRDKASERVMRLARALGMTPAARASMEISRALADPNWDPAWAEFDTPIGEVIDHDPTAGQ